MLAVLVAALLSQSSDRLSFDCGRAQTTVDINACFQKELGRETARMEHYMATAEEFAERQDESTAGTPEASDQRRLLKEAQHAWQAYQKIVCNGVYDKWSGGSIRNAATLRCHIDMTRERTFVIWRDFIKPADSSESELPDPR